jgi:hypothetical protein
MLKGHGKAMGNFIEWILFFLYEMANRRICNSRIMPYESLHKPLAKEQ